MLVIQILIILDMIHQRLLTESSPGRAVFKPDKSNLARCQVEINTFFRFYSHSHLIQGHIRPELMKGGITPLNSPLQCLLKNYNLQTRLYLVLINDTLSLSNHPEQILPLFLAFGMFRFPHAKFCIANVWLKPSMHFVLNHPWTMEDDLQLITLPRSKISYILACHMIII